MQWIPLSLLVLSQAGAASSQEGAPAPSAKVELVRLDAIVTDGQGNPVGNLKGDDFVVLEDGKRQQLAQFVIAGKESAETSPPAGRQIAIIVDDLHIALDSVNPLRNALRTFVQGHLKPEDNVALVNTSGLGGAPALTTDRADLLDAIDHLQTHDTRPPQIHASDISPEQAELILRGDISALQLVATTMTEEVGNRNSREEIGLGAAMSSHLAQPAGAGSDPVLGAAMREAQRSARGILAQSLQYSVVTLNTIESVLRSLATSPGRKLCLLVSDGFLVGAGTDDERLREIQGIIDAATRSGAVVYALDSKGLVATVQDAAAVAGPTSMPELQHGVARQSELLLQKTLERLSHDTGGLFVQGAHDLEGSLQRMLEEGETYYLMAYEPTNAKQDGKFRKIEVRVAQHPDYLVRTRAGYFAPGAKVATKATGSTPLSGIPKPGPVELDAPSLRAILATPVSASGGIPVKMSVDYLEQPAGPQALVQASFDVAGLHWVEKGGQHQASFDVAGSVYDEKGVEVGLPFGRRVEVSRGATEYKKAEGLRFQQQVPLPPGRYEVRVAVRDTKGNVGHSTQWVEIPNLATKKLALSGLFLSASSGPAAGSAAAQGAGEALYDHQISRRFKSAESLYFQLYVYNPLTDPSGSSDVVLQAQIWSAGKVVAASKAQAVALRREKGILAPETEEMSLAGLTPGPYSLKVVVVDRKAQVTASRSVDFTVE